MNKTFNIKFLPVFILLLFNTYPKDMLAVDSNIKNKTHYNVESVETNRKLPDKKGFLKRFFKKIAEKVKETKRKIVKKIKRKVSKHKAKKDVMKGSLKERNRNLFNILVFSGIFILLAIGITVLFLYGIISSAAFLVLSLILGISSIVIALIYFSNRYIIKPHFRS